METVLKPTPIKMERIDSDDASDPEEEENDAEMITVSFK